LLEHITHCYTPKSWEQNVILIGEGDTEDTTSIGFETRTS